MFPVCYVKDHAIRYPTDTWASCWQQCTTQCTIQRCVNNSHSFNPEKEITLTMNWLMPQESDGLFHFAAAKMCRNLTEEDAPAHGGLVCHIYNEENSKQCTVKCNPGYELPTRINTFETCGPVTGYTWSYKRTDPEARLAPCIGTV